jgi:hypothetical protein
MFKNQNNHKGMSYIEVAICLFAVSIVILPLSQAFVASVKLKEETKSISQSTFYAETLLEEVKKQLERDLIRREKVDLGEIPNEELAYYLDDELTKQERTEPTLLNKLFNHTLTEADEFNQKYNLSQYSYEVALWQMKDVLIEAEEDESESEKEKIEISVSLLDEAIKFYTDAEENYQLKASELSIMPKFNLSKDYKGLFKDELFLNNFLPEADNNDSPVIGSVLLKLRMNEENINTTIINSGHIEVKAGISPHDNVHVYNIELEDGYTIPAPDEGEPANMAVVVLDTRALGLEEIEKTILKFNNNTNLPVNLKILMDRIEEDEDVVSFDDKINIIISDNNDKKTTIERIMKLDREENYLIAVIVRDKDPKIGLSGKIVKTMMDVYSFENSQE